MSPKTHTPETHGPDTHNQDTPSSGEALQQDTSADIIGHPALSDPAADLALIRSMMQEGRNRIGVDGQIVAIWGGILTLAFMAIYLVIAAKLPVPQLVVWGIAITVGWGLSFWARASQARCLPQSADNPVLRGYSAAWFAVGISCMIGFFVSTTGSDGFSGHIMMLLTSALFGTAFFTTAMLMQIRWMIWVAVGWWIALGVFGYVGYFTLDMLLATPLLTFFLVFLPGLKLMHDTKKGYQAGAGQPS